MGGEERRNVRAGALCLVITQAERGGRGEGLCWELETLSEGDVTQLWIEGQLLQKRAGDVDLSTERAD